MIPDTTTVDHVKMVDNVDWLYYFKTKSDQCRKISLVVRQRNVLLFCHKNDMPIIILKLFTRCMQQLGISVIYQNILSWYIKSIGDSQVNNKVSHIIWTFQGRKEITLT